MIYISEKNKNSSDVVASFLEEIGLGEGFRIISDDIATDKKFKDDDIVIFTSRGSLVAAMLTKDNCRMTKVVLISSSIDGGEKKLIGCSGIVFIKKGDDGKYLDKLFNFMK